MAASVVAALVLLLSSTLILYSLWFVLAGNQHLFVEGLERHRGAAAPPLVAGPLPPVPTPIPWPLRTFFTFVLPVAFLTTRAG